MFLDVVSYSPAEEAGIMLFYLLPYILILILGIIGLIALIKVIIKKIKSGVTNGKKGN